MRHDPHYVASGVAYAGDIVHRPVRIVRDIAQHDLAVGLELGCRLRIGDKTSVPVRDWECQLFTPLVPAGEGRVRRLDPHMYRPRQKLETGVAHQRAGQQSRLAQNLEPVADAEYRATGARVGRHRAEYRRKAGDGPGPKIIAVAETARQDDRVRLLQVGIAVPDVIGVRSGRPGRVERVRVAIRAGKDDYCDTLHS